MYRSWINRFQQSSYINPIQCSPKSNKIQKIAFRYLSSKPVKKSKPVYDFSLLKDKDDRTICKAREMLGFKTPPLFVLRKSSVYLYESCTDQIDIVKYFEVLGLEDTFNSWFAITRWHVWMVACRCMNDRINGITLRNELIKRMWEDVNNRSDKLFYMKRRDKLKTIQHYYAVFNASLFGMDEGLLREDVVLAGAIWRNVMGMDPKLIDPILLETLVHYTRVQSHYLATSISANHILFDGSFKWKHFPPLVIGDDDNNNNHHHNTNKNENNLGPN